MQKHAIKSLFKPYKINKKRFIDFLDKETKINYFKHRIWFECSKSIDESCINSKCRYNLIKVHNTELYIELMQEIQNEKLAIEKRNNGDGIEV